MRFKDPPKAKVYEAISAVQDGRVERVGPQAAVVTSSGGDKTYRVTWSADFAEFGSSDNASVFQGYIGYPIIAALLELGRLPLDRERTRALAGVQWNKLNQLYKRNYDAAVDHVLEAAHLTSGEQEYLTGCVDEIHLALLALHLDRRSAKVK